MSNQVAFHVIPQSAPIPFNARGWSAYLNQDKWDDWGEYCTQFYLTIVDEVGKQHSIGQLKIGQRGLEAYKPNIEGPFHELTDDFFSVGQEIEYYTNLTALGETMREQILSSLRDVAYDAQRWEWAKKEEVMGRSLLRSVTSRTVEGQFRRASHGNAPLTRFDFTYLPPGENIDSDSSFRLDFSVNPGSSIPSNVHVLIGRNGVGKTRLLSLMAKALVRAGDAGTDFGSFIFNENKNIILDENDDSMGTFANVIVVSFSAFDEHDLLSERQRDQGSIGYTYIGLRDYNSESKIALIESKTPSKLAGEFVKSLMECRIGPRRKWWKSAIEALQSDPVFKAAQIDFLIDKNLTTNNERKLVEDVFKALSSGHKIVLLTLTRLVEEVEEKTLVLIDEPEAHLHPPLLSAMTRAVSELMVKRNGVAIVATHSPVILQEVPRSCAWILNRTLTASKAERPSIQTFAEGIGILSREVFQLELSQSGYHQILSQLRRNSTSYDEAIAKLDDELGAEGRAVLRGLFLNDSSPEQI